MTLNPLLSGFLASLALLLLGALVSFVAAHYWFGRTAQVVEARRVEDDRQAVLKRLVEIEKQLSLLGQVVVPINTAFQAILIKELTHYHTPEMDALMVKLGPPVTLTDDEEHRLGILLVERTLDMGALISDAEREAARVLPAVIRRAKLEALLMETPTAFQLVSVGLLPVVHYLRTLDTEEPRPGGAPAAEGVPGEEERPTA